MPADLSAVKRRVAEAKSELDGLRGEVDAFTSAVPSPWRLERQRTRCVEALVSYIDREPDPAWGDRVGYIAVKARSALDQLTTQLVLDSGNDPARKKSYFPIFAHPDAYLAKSKKGGNSERDRRLAGVASRHRKIIDQLQPYQRGPQKAVRDPLYLLNAIANREKHEDTHAVWAAITGTTFRLLFSDGRVHSIVIRKDDDPDPLVDGQTLVGSDGSNLLPGQSIRIEVDEVRIGLAFEGKVTVSLDQVDAAILHVSRIIDRFGTRIAARRADAS
jgi:hypothetical protein